MIGIYKITNKINNKCYIGQSRNIERRWKRHIQENNDSAIHRAIKKYGVENFSFEVIEECSTEELDKKEIYWINFYNSIDKEKGYNLTLGGLGGAHSVKLEEKEVEEIIFLLKNSNLRIQEIADKFDVSHGLIIKIKNGEVWNKTNLQYPLRKDLDNNKGQYNGKSKFSNEEIKYIRKKKEEGFKPSQIHKEFKDRITIKGFYKIWYGERYKNI